MAPPVSPPPSVLSALCATLAPGTWAAVPTQGLTSEFLLTGNTPGVGTSPLTSYAYPACWHDTSAQFVFYGAGHYVPSKMVVYDEANNTWTVGPLHTPCAGYAPGALLPDGITKGCSWHTYGQLAIDQVRGKIYHKSFDNLYKRHLYVYDLATATWSLLTTIPSALLAPSQTAVLVYVPPLNALLVISSSDLGANKGRVHRYDCATDTWTLPITGLTMGGSHPVGVYDPVHELCIFGGGNNAATPVQTLYTIDLAGTVTRRADVPSAIAWRVMGSLGCALAADPVTGTLLVLSTTGAGTTFWGYDVVDDVWTQLPTPPAGLSIAATNAVLAPVATHGVLFGIRWDGSRTKAFVYKHAEAVPVPLPDTEPPVVVILAPLPGLVSETVALEATITDDLGVMRAQWLLDGQPLGAPLTIPPYAATWDTTQVPNDVHTLSLEAQDAAGNSGSAAVEVVVQNLQLPPPQPDLPSGIPSLEQERATYLAWGLTWTPDKEPAIDPATIPPVIFNPDLHDVTEGDPLHAVLVQWLRTNDPHWLTMAQRWYRYFLEDWTQSLPTIDPRTGVLNRKTFANEKGWGRCHYYGTGLALWHQVFGDAAVLPILDVLEKDLTAYYLASRYVAGVTPMAVNRLRAFARHLRLACACVDVTRLPAWEALRARLTELLVRSPDWDATYGTYWTNAPQTDSYIGVGSYNAGWRIVALFPLGILSEAYAAVYAQTRDVRVQEKVVAMAHFLRQYGKDPRYPTWPFIHSMIGRNLQTGDAWGSYDASKQPGDTEPRFANPHTQMSVVNILALGYQYSGDVALWDTAKAWYLEGSRGRYGSKVPTVPPDQAGLFLDARLDPGTQYTLLGPDRGGQLGVAGRVLLGSGAPPPRLA